MSDHTPEWHARRAKVIGGSEIAALFGVQPDYALSHYALWMVKAGRVPPLPVDNPRVAWGNRLETVIAEIAAQEHGWGIEKGHHAVDPECPGLGATLDFVILDDPAREHSGAGALEVKNVDWLVHRRSWDGEEPPLHILLQLQHQLAATGYNWGVVAALVGGNNLVVYRYEARPKLIAEIRLRVRAFWESIEDGREPQIDGSNAATAVLKALYPEALDEAVDLTADNETPIICAELLKAAETRMAAEKIESEMKNRLRAKLGAHKRAEAQGFRISVAVTPEKPDSIISAAMVGHALKGRAESRRYTVKELT